MRNVKFVPGKIYHIYNRGVDKRDIFMEDADKWRCLQGLCLFNDEKNSNNVLWQIEKSRGEVNLKILKDYIIKEGKKSLARILAYSLMPNHYHLLVEELRDGGISKFMHKFGNGYAHYFNEKYQRSGSLFEGRFKAVLVENEIYLQYLKEEGIRDMETVIRAVDEYPWGTHQEYSGKRGSIIIDKGVLGEIFPTPERYRDFVEQVLLDKKYQEISHLTLES